MHQRCEFVKNVFPDLYDKALYTYVSSCMYHLQLAINAKQEKMLPIILSAEFLTAKQAPMLIMQAQRISYG